MNNRISSVAQLQNTIIDTTSILQIGDMEAFKPVVLGISVQRDHARFSEQEFDMGKYPYFFRPLLHPQVTENVHMIRHNETPVIHAQHITIFRVLGASMIHIGSSQVTRAESRTKNIRHLLVEPPSK